MAPYLKFSGSGDATVRHWDVVGGALLAEFKAHTASVKSIDVNVAEPSKCGVCALS